MASAASSYPVNFTVEPQMENRNRLTVAFRIILAIPHLLLVGGLAFTFGGGAARDADWWWGFGGGGVLGAVAFVCAVISWFAILFANQHPQGLQDLCRFYLRWRARVMAYVLLLRDEYPPFGDAGYPAQAIIGETPVERDKLSVGLRLIYLIPHIVVLFFLGIAVFVTSIIGWFAILFTGAYPQGLYEFAANYYRWSLRVEAYGLLLQDQYPPFSLSA